MEGMHHVLGNQTKAPRLQANGSFLVRNVKQDLAFVNVVQLFGVVQMRLLMNKLVAKGGLFACPNMKADSA